MGLAKLCNFSEKFIVKDKKHICIVGDGAAGWIAYHSLKNCSSVSKITVIGSPSIPKIGVGESTTLSFHKWLHEDLRLTESEIKQFLVDIDAAIKYGVNYEGWSPKKFLHHLNINQDNLTKSRFALGNRPENISHNEAVVPLADHIYENKVYLAKDGNWLDQSLQTHSYHFDAGKFIETAHKLAKKDEQLNYVSDTVVDAIYQGDLVDHLLLESGTQVKADYYISCIGQTSFNQRVFREEYISYSDYLLTTKALFCPIEFNDPVADFHPYTIAKAMPNGWRWITPTRSRIGTGYVFSDNHISIDQAVDEFRKDAGIPDLNPHVVDFWPRRVKEVFKPNLCTLGMASGFQEPLDAPGLSMTFSSLGILKDYIGRLDQNNISILKTFNEAARSSFNFWCSFILHQYKTSHRNDTSFWKDHKNVNFDYYDAYVNDIFNNPIFSSGKDDRVLIKNPKISTMSSKEEPWMFYNTSSGKDIKWEVNFTESYDLQPKESIDLNRVVTHKEYIDKLGER